MKSIRLYFAASLLLAGSMYAEAKVFQDDSISISSCRFHSSEPLTPTYLDDAVGGLSFWSNWFLSVQGGEAAFMGKPLGCSDFFGRTKPLLLTIFSVKTPVSGSNDVPLSFCEIDVPSS